MLNVKVNWFSLKINIIVLRKRGVLSYQLNTHFTNVGRELADKLPTTNVNANHYIKRSFRDIFTFRSILVHEVHDLIMGINLNKSTIEVPQKCIKLASSHINECLTFIFN